MTTDRMKWARAIERVRRIYEIKAQCEEYTENLRRSDRVIEGKVPREVERMLFTDWDRVLDRVWESYHTSARYEAVVLRRLLSDVTLAEEYHVHEGATGYVTSVDPDGSVHYDEESFGDQVHRYMNAYDAQDAEWVLVQEADILDRYAAPEYRHHAYTRHVVRD